MIEVPGGHVRHPMSIIEIADWNHSGRIDLPYREKFSLIILASLNNYQRNSRKIQIQD